MTFELNIDDTALAKLPQHEAAVIKEYLRRRDIARRSESFLDFVQQVAPWFVFDEVHVLIARRLEALKRGEIDRLMVMIAPRAGKSLMCSELLPAWWMGHNPKDKVLHTSYASSLVEKFGRKIRNMVASPDYQQMFPKTKVAKDSKAAAQWATTEGGEYNAVGVGGGVAGKGFMLGLCVAPDSTVVSKRGALPAAEVDVGDYLLGATGWGRVTKKCLTTHENQVTINSRLTCSLNHPVWVVGRGWVEASELQLGDRVETQTIWSKLWILLPNPPSVRRLLYTLRNFLSAKVGRQ
jgi:hypothetical protein